MGERDQCPACGYDAGPKYREYGVVAGCKNDDCRVEGFLPVFEEDDSA